MLHVQNNNLVTERPMGRNEADPIDLSCALEFKLYSLRKKDILLDVDLAALYDVPVARIREEVQAIPPNPAEDLLFQLTSADSVALGNQGLLAARIRPEWAFTDYGVLLMAGYLKKKHVSQVTMQILALFRTPQPASGPAPGVLQRIDALEKYFGTKLCRQQEIFTLIFDELRQLYQ